MPSGIPPLRSHLAVGSGEQPLASGGDEGDVHGSGSVCVLTHAVVRHVGERGAGVVVGVLDDEVGGDPPTSGRQLVRSQRVRTDPEVGMSYGDPAEE